MKNLFEKLFLLQGTNYAEICPQDGKSMFIGKVRYLSNDHYDPALFWVDDYEKEDLVKLGDVTLNPGFLDEKWATGIISFFKLNDTKRRSLSIRIELTDRVGEISFGPIKQVLLQTHSVIVDEKLSQFVSEGDELWWNFITSYFLDVIMLPYDTIEEIPISSVDIGPIGEVWNDLMVSSLNMKN